jgi:hypothetical protein
MPRTPADFESARADSRMRFRVAISRSLVLLIVSFAPTAHAAERADGQLELEIMDTETGQPIAARVHLRSTRARSVPLRRPETAEYSDHFYVDGRLSLPLRIGQYTMEIEATPEYRTIKSQPFEIQRHSDDTKKVEMPRFANLNQEGWWAGDLDVARPIADLPLAMRAEGLSIVANRTPLAAKGPPRLRSPGKSARDAAAGESGDSSDESTSLPPGSDQIVNSRVELDERAGGGLLLVDVEPPTSLAKAKPYAPTSLTVLRDAHQAGGRVIARTPYAWDFPVWLARGELDAIQLIHHHSLRNEVNNKEDDGRPRDRTFFPGTSGNGRWSESIYYHVLNCGLRIPPVAGSGSGTNGSPLGNNRVYAFCGSEFDEARWWEAVESGRVVVTNGPLLRPMVEGRPPGHVFTLEQGDTLTLEVGLELATRVPVEYLQVIKNGQVEAEVRLAEWKGKKGRLPAVAFDDSGWFLVRAVTNDRRNYQFASSGPYYVQRGNETRISRKSVKFFLEWIDAAQERLGKLHDLQDTDRAALLAEQGDARQFFQQLLDQANAD